MTVAIGDKSAFMALYQGYLQGVMQWSDLDQLLQLLKGQTDKKWYVYHVGEACPTTAVGAEKLTVFLTEIDLLLKKEHDEDYCGIVYVNDPQDPKLIKIYDPNNLGMVCGFSEKPPLPGWVLSVEKPEDLVLAFPPVASRKRWWKRIFS